MPTISIVTFILRIIHKISTRAPKRRFSFFHSIRVKKNPLLNRFTIDVPNDQDKHSFYLLGPPPPKTLFVLSSIPTSQRSQIEGKWNERITSVSFYESLPFHFVLRRTFPNVFPKQSFFSSLSVWAEPPLNIVSCSLITLTRLFNHRHDYCFIRSLFFILLFLCFFILFSLSSLILSSFFFHPPLILFILPILFIFFHSPN